MTKGEARALARARRAAFTPDTWRAWGAAMAAAATALPVWAAAKAVFAFAALPDEPDTTPLLRAALQGGKRLFLPRVAGRRLETVPASGPAALRAGAYGILEPCGPAAPLPQNTLALVPCLAAGRDGARLGRGGGYYDRFLAGYTGARLLLCPRALVWDTLPCDIWDIRFSPAEILTENGLLSEEKEDFLP